MFLAITLWQIHLNKLHRCTKEQNLLSLSGFVGVLWIKKVIIHFRWKEIQYIFTEWLQKSKRFSFDSCACDPGPVPYLHNQICLACFQLFFLHNNMVDHHIQGKHIFIAVWINKDRLKHFYSWLLYRCNLSNIATIHQF